MRLQPRHRVLSLAPGFGVGHLPFSGHEEIYQLDLLHSARSLDVDWRILVPSGSAVDVPGVLRRLDVSSDQAMITSLSEALDGDSAPDGGPPLQVVFYECRPELLGGLTQVAREHPDVSFILNLFASIPGFDVPFVRAGRGQLEPRLGFARGDALREHIRMEVAPTWASNVVLTAETDQKALVARSLGLPIAGIWALHSALHSAPIPVAGASRHDRSAAVRVMVSVSERHLNARMAGEIAEIVVAVRRFRPGLGCPRFVLPVRGTGRIGSRSVALLARSGVEILRDEGPLDMETYAARFLEVDAVWFPQVGYYRVQSSGKALDALLMGRPIVAPVGTSPARMMERYVPGAPVYGSTAEAIQVLSLLPGLLPFLSAELAGQADVLRVRHSPTTTVEWLLGLPVGDPSTYEVSGSSSRPEPDVILTPRSLGQRLAGRVRRVLWRIQELPRGYRRMAEQIARY